MKKISGGHLLRDWRYRNGVTQRELADMLGADAWQISHYERGARRPCLDRILAIEKITGIAPRTWEADHGS